MAPPLGRDKRVVDGGGGPLTKILEAYMSEAALPTDPPEHIWQFAPGGCSVVLATL